MIDKKQHIVLLWILGVILFCLICYLLWRFGSEHRDFITSLIALGGVVAVVIGVFQTQNRITKQEKQFNKQQHGARYTSGVELLGNPHESARIGGAYNLYFLARDYPEFSTSVCEILCAHIRTITSNKDYQDTHKERPSNEVQTIVDLLFKKQENDSSIFLNKKKDLCNTFLCGVNFSWTTEGKGVVLKYVAFDNSVLHKVDFQDVSFQWTTFQNTELNYVYFCNAKLDAVIFDDAKLLYVDFTNAKFGSIYFNNAKPYTLDFTGTIYEECSIEEITLDRRTDDV